MGKKSEKKKKSKVKNLKKEKKSEDDHYDDMEDSRVSRSWEDGEEQKGAENEDDPLKGLVEGFFISFNEFEREFTSAVKAKLKGSSTLYAQVKKLYAKIKA